ncbi:MAG: lytic murein transglycosylase [Candidatus Nealsonbacteria bacterium]|nr:lytic murein transglycosylase [Candidatus Nealsonbacteria bacterium]
MKLKILQILLVFVLVLGFALPASKFFLKANENLEEICQIDKLDKDCESLSATDCRQLLEKCEIYFQEKSDKIAEDIGKTEAEKKTLKNQISVLSGKITKLNYQIDQNNIMIRDLGLQINDTQGSIDKTTLKIEESKSQLAEVLREVYEQDQKSTIEILIGNEKLSDFFDNLTALESLNEKNQQLLEDIKNLKNSLEDQKKSLGDEEGQLESTVKLQILQKAENDKNKKDQEYFLKLTEAEYQKYLKEKTEVEKQTAEIRSRIFALIGVAKAPSFGEAVELAKYVEKSTGVRAAFLLAIISQESAIGRNVGQCVLTDLKTGDGKKLSSGDLAIRVMKPTRDVSPFLELTSSLGRDPYNTPVSCWIPMYSKGSPYGWGGAMGPAQFIPSTWNLYADKLKTLLGLFADPWAIKDSFTAAGLFLADLGASAQTSAKESSAASRYYGGSSGYTAGVKARATCIQSFIDNGTMSSNCQDMIF